MARRSSSLWRGIIVALSCISAVWLIFINCERIADYIRHFNSGYSFFEYFFSEELLFFATLFIGISFFTIIIRDLWALKRPVLWIALVFSAACFIALIIDLFFPVLSFGGSFLHPFKLIAKLLMSLAYIIYCIAGINSRRYQPFAFFFGLFCALLVLISQILIITESKSSPAFSLFVPHIMIFAANAFVFKCTLYER